MCLAALSQLVIILASSPVGNRVCKAKGGWDTTVATKGVIEVFKYNKGSVYNGDTKNGKGKFRYRRELA